MLLDPTAGAALGSSKREAASGTAVRPIRKGRSRLKGSKNKPRDVDQMGRGSAQGTRSCDKCRSRGRGKNSRVTGRG